MAKRKFKIFDLIPGLAGALQTLLFSILIIVIPVTASVMGSQVEASQSVSWDSGALAGMKIWALAQGFPITVSDGTFSIVPLGVSAIITLVAFWCAKAGNFPRRETFISQVWCYVLLTGLIGGLVNRPPILTFLFALLFTTLLAIIGFGAGNLANPEWRAGREMFLRHWYSADQRVRFVLRVASFVLAAVTIISVLISLWWVLANRQSVVQVFELLQLDLVGAVSLAGIEFAVFPVLVNWAFAWWLGPGFYAGGGALFTSSNIPQATLPPLPVFAHLPSPDMASGWVLWAPALVVLFAFFGTYLTVRRVTSLRWWEVFIWPVVIGLITGGAAGFVTKLANGGIAGGQMSQFGASGLWVALILASWTALGTVLCLMVFRPEFHSAVKNGSLNVYHWVQDLRR